MKRSGHLLGFAAAILIPLALYGYTAARSPINYADSNELMTAAYVGGVAHPPGYPLYIAFLGWWMHLGGLTPAHLANLSSGIFQSLSLGVLYLVILELVTLIRVKDKPAFFFVHPAVGPILALITTLTLATSYHFWFHALIAEVFALNHLFAGLILWLALKIHSYRLMLAMDGIQMNDANTHPGNFLLSIKNKLTGAMYLLAVLLGLATAHHQSILLLVPGIGILAINPTISIKTSLTLASMRTYIHSLAKVWPLGATVLLATLLPFLLIYYFDAQHAPFSWYVGPGMQGLWDLITRNLYGQEGSAIEIYAKDWNLAHSWHSVGVYLKLLREDLTVGGMVLGGLGIGFTWIKNRRIFSFLLVSLLVSGPLLAAYLKFPIATQNNDNAYFWGVALRWRMFLLHEYLFALAIGIGCLVVMHFANYGWSRTLINFPRLRQPLFYLCLISLGVLPFWIFMQNLNLLEIPHTTIDHQFYQEMVDQLPKNALLLVDTDHVFGLLYQQLVEHRRPDLLIIPTTLEMRWHYLRELDPPVQILHYAPKAQRLADLVSWNLFRGRYVFLLSPDFAFLEYLGVEANPFYAVPSGYLIEISRQPQQVPIGAYSLSQLLIDRADETISLWERGFSGDMATIHTTLGWYFAKAGFQKQADQHFTLATDLALLTQSHSAIRNTQAKVNQDINHYLLATSPTSFQYSDQGDQALKRLDLDTALVYLRKSLLLEPFNLKARQQLIEVLTRLNQPAQAEQERGNLNQILKHVLPSY